MNSGGLDSIPPVVIRTFLTDGTEDLFGAFLSGRGIEVVDAPMIEICFINFEPEMPVALYKWLIFTSKNGIKAWFSVYKKEAGQRVAVIGESSAMALRDYAVEADFIGSGHSAKVFAEELLPELLPGDSVLLVVGNLASNVIADVLSGNDRRGEASFSVSRIEVYETIIPSVINEAAIERIIRDDYALIAVASPSAVQKLMQILGNRAGKLRFASIGSVTSRALRSYGLEAAVEAEKQNFPELAECCWRFIRKNYNNKT
jgi:uroporphyrinogen-III synthase